MFSSGRVLVTGGAGFIGGHITERLLSDGHSVRIFDNFATGKRATIDHLVEVAPSGKLEVVEGDVRDATAVVEAMKGVTHVAHQAALASVQRSMENPLATHEVNTTGTLNILQAARHEGVERLVFAGSSSVYGDKKDLPKVETMRAAPKSPYALSKHVGEVYCNLYNDLFGLSTIVLRYFNVFGPRQDPNSQYAAVIPLFARALLRGESPTVHGDGGQTRDFTFIDNVVHGNLLALSGRGKGGSVYNLACGDRHSLLDLLKRLGEMTGSTVEPNFVESRLGDVRDSQAGIDKAVAELGFEPQVAYGAGLEKTVAWCRQSEDVVG